jgi:putative hydrolase of the HAD superfamily
MVVKDVFFDLDRTLWDFETNSLLALSQLFTEFGLNQKIEQSSQFIEDYKRINEYHWDLYRKGLTTKEKLRIDRFYEALLLHGVDDVKLAADYCEAYIQRCPELTHTFPGTHDTLEELRKMGYQMHIITNGFSEVQYRKMENCGILSYFDVIVCSDQVGVNKPEPEIFRIAIQQAKAQAAQSVMIGDHPEIDVLGANAAGMRGILFDPEHQYPHHNSIEKIQRLEELPLRLLGVTR